MSKKRDIHVVPNGPGRWNVKGAGDNVSSTHRTQQAAIDAGRRQARTNQSELVIHGRDGQIRDKDSYGNDPCPPKDKKH